MNGDERMHCPHSDFVLRLGEVICDFHEERGSVCCHNQLRRTVSAGFGSSTSVFACAIDPVIRCVRGSVGCMC